LNVAEIQVTIPAELVDLFAPAYQWWKVESGNDTLTLDQWVNRIVATEAMPILKRYQEHLIQDIINNLGA
jgi:hypothetical protein